MYLCEFYQNSLIGLKDNDQKRSNADTDEDADKNKTTPSFGLGDIIWNDTRNEYQRISAITEQMLQVYAFFPRALHALPKYSQTCLKRPLKRGQKKEFSRLRIIT